MPMLPPARLREPVLRLCLAQTGCAGQRGARLPSLQTAHLDRSRRVPSVRPQRCGLGCGRLTGHDGTGPTSSVLYTGVAGTRQASLGQVW